MTKHKQVKTKFGFMVDEQLLEIIESLNNTGFVTCNSCQKNKDGYTWIVFKFTKDSSGKELIEYFQYNNRLSEYFIQSKDVWTLAVNNKGLTRLDRVKWLIYTKELCELVFHNSICMVTLYFCTADIPIVKEMLKEADKLI